MGEQGGYPRDSDCIFCKIVAGRIPCYELYRDDDVLSFLDVAPLSRGHCLVIPTGHWKTIDQVPDEVAAACMRVVPRLSRAIMRATGATAWNILQNNGKAAHQAVDHVHLHIIAKSADLGLAIRWSPDELDDGESLVESIRQHL